VSAQPVPGRPTVEQVAVLIRARTKDDVGNEVGTFDSDTRPTDVQVEEMIDGAFDSIAMRLPDPTAMPVDVLAGMVQVVALETACRIEKTFWPEQVRTDRSNYAVLKVERDEELAALVEVAKDAAGSTEYAMGDISSVPVGSWTSIPPSWLPDEYDLGA
jgi:hypothetical protein